MPHLCLTKFGAKCFSTSSYAGRVLVRVENKKVRNQEQRVRNTIFITREHGSAIFFSFVVVVVLVCLVECDAHVYLTNGWICYCNTSTSHSEKKPANVIRGTSYIHPYTPFHTMGRFVRGVGVPHGYGTVKPRGVMRHEEK